jgi:LacI family transcriptional regulator
VNLEQGAVDALRHLLASNPRRIGFFGPGISDEGSVLDTYAAPGTLDPRISAYCRTMQEAGRPYEIIAGNPGSRRASMEALRSYIAKRECPDALFCFNDEMAIGASRALRECGIRVPVDVLLIGCDGTEEGEYMDPPLSTIAQPVSRMCSLAWEFVTNRLNDPGMNQQYVRVDAQFIRRGSSEPA